MNMEDPISSHPTSDAPSSKSDVKQAGPPQGEGAAGSRKRRRRLLPVVIPLLLALLVLAGGAYWYLELRGVIDTDDATIDGDRMVVSTKVPGRITTLGADEGDTVQVGELLVQLDDSDLQARVAQAMARLSLAQDNVTLADVNVREAEDDFNRAQMQYQGQAIPKEDLDHAQSALAAARAQQGIAMAQVQTARADLDVVQTQLEDTKVYSTFAGVVAKRWVLPGEVVQPGQPILTLFNLADVWVTALFEETKIREIPMGSRAEVSVDAFPNRPLHGTVILIGAAAASQFSLIPPQNASGNFTKVTQRVPVRIALDRPAGAQGSQDRTPLRLVPGMSVVVTILKPGEEG